jgi:CheY-like chemotaxis protein
LDEARQNLEVIFQSTKDAAKMVERLRNFYRPKAEHEVYAPVPLAELVRVTVDLAQPKWKNLARDSGKYIVVTTNVPEDFVVRGDAAELREMLVNLIFNAVDAMPKGGHISIRARATEGGVILEISDTGGGMSEEVKQRCLEPFFTTKGENGTGLGLAMVHGIVRRHEGSLEIHTEPGRGTTFAIRLPADEAVATPKAPAERKLPRLRILFADDDAAIRRFVPMSLGRNGHEVTVACDGNEALELYEPGKYDLVLTDLSMPRMSGDKLARAIKERSANQPIIILTGYSDTLLKQSPKPGFVDLLLNKPVTSQQLSAAIAKVLPVTAPLGCAECVGGENL